MRRINKIVAFLLLGLLFMLGVNFRPEQNYDYSSGGALTDKNGVVEVDFNFLGGYKYGDSEDIPEPVRELDGRMVELSGFMLPVDTRMGEVSSFLILNSRMACCFGVMPRENEFVFAKMQNGETVDYMNDTPVSVSGIFEVGKENEVSGIYTLKVKHFSLKE